MNVFIDERKIELRGGNVSEMRLEDLRRELKRLRVPGLGGKENKDELIAALYAHLTKIAGAIRTPGSRFVYPLPQEQIRAAIAFIEEKASDAAWNSK
jgi:hypothetical protein